MRAQREIILCTLQLCEIDFKTKLNFHEWLVWFFVVFVAVDAVVTVVKVVDVVVVTVVVVTAVVVVVDVDVCVPFRQPGPKKMSELDNETRRRTQFCRPQDFLSKYLTLEDARAWQRSQLS